MSFEQYDYVRTCLRLPLEFDAERALREISSIPRHLYDNASRSPTHSDVQAVFIRGYPPRFEKPDDDREILKSLPYLSSYIKEELPGEPCKCMIAELRAGGVIPVHSDAPVYSDGQAARDVKGANYFVDTLRLHLPVATSGFTSFFTNGEFFYMCEGEVWAINNLAVHGVINEHPTDTRIHLIVDILPDDRTEAALSQARNTRGSYDRVLLAKLMENSMAPADSIYARGRPVPDQQMLKGITEGLQK